MVLHIRPTKPDMALILLLQQSNYHRCNTYITRNYFYYYNKNNYYFRSTPANRNRTILTITNRTTVIINASVTISRTTPATTETDYIFNNTNLH